MTIPAYPNVPSVGKTDTSREAAESIAPKAPVLRERALSVLRERPSTADEVSEALGESVLSIRPRVSELAATNTIYDTGLRRRNIFGRNCVVWATFPDQYELFS